MSYASKTLSDAAIGVGVADDPASLSVLKKPGCAAAVWRRQTPKNIQAWLDRLDPNTLPRGRVVASFDALAQAVQDLFDLADTPNGDELDWLHQDITHMATVFAELMSVDRLRIRLDVITSNACRKFHIDAVTARLVCTYRGSGTQYGVSIDGGEPRRVFQVATGAPILLRGTLWPEDPPSGLLHRSPPIEGTGETRLVLVLDPIFDTDEKVGAETLVQMA